MVRSIQFQKVYFMRRFAAAAAHLPFRSEVEELCNALVKRDIFCVCQHLILLDWFERLANYYYLFLKAPNGSLQYFVVPI
jgi:hypothetical protein